MPAKAAPHQPEGKVSNGNSELSALPRNQGQPVGQKPLVMSQPGVPRAASQPLQKPPAHPLAQPVVQPSFQEEQQPGQLGLNPEPLSQVKGQLAQPKLGHSAASEQGYRPPDAASLPISGRLPQPPIAGHIQDQLESAGKPVEQPPVQLQPAAGNQGPPVLPAPNIAKPQQSAAELENVAGLEKVPIGNGAAPAKAGSSHAGAAFKKALDELEDGNELEGAAVKVLSNKVPNNGGDALVGGHGEKVPRAKLARPNQHQQLAAGGIGGGEDDLDYANAAVKDDDAAEDQEDDGPFGADLGRGKPMPDAADFEDQNTLTSSSAVKSIVRMDLPTYSGYHDLVSANEYLDRMLTYQQATGLSDSEMLERLGPVSLTDQAARWFRFTGHKSRTL
ncbi:hypothetical protein HPB50_014354 [Hyalomma asiaticum]|uniref:Uncharacterized protein n=1 Tax=Hyalomma asiaticum TaxID=266040 RepID=A0ACB7SF72_HYAAI|nr:hypothetical protein HPB50_014354 [Hyalomma asiaticum]